MAVQSLKKIMAGMLGAAMLLTAVACGTTDESTDAKAEAKAGFDVSTVKKDDTIAAMLPKSVADSGELTVGMELSYAPAEFVGDDGKTPEGYDVDLAKALGKVFGLDRALLVGVILVGTCPGGTASNVITYLSKGDVGLSVGMTSVSTVLAPLLTPALTYLFLRTSVDVDVKAMMISMIQVVAVPIGLGILINKLLPKVCERIKDILPSISVAAICVIIASVVSHNSEKILSTGAVIFAVVILHNLLGYAFGYLAGVLFKMDLPRKKAVAVEVGMQNSGLAASLAGSAFPDLSMATVPGAVFSVWHNISGAVLAAVFRRMGMDKDTEKKDKQETS